MPLQCSKANPEDAIRIAEIEFVALASNVMLHAQFPTDDALKGFQRWLEVEFSIAIEDPNTTVLVVRRIKEMPDESQSSRNSGPNVANDQDSAIIGFAKWIQNRK